MIRDIQLNTEVTGMVFNEQDVTWTVTTKDHGMYTARFLITALGISQLSTLPFSTALGPSMGSLCTLRSGQPTVL